MDAIRRPPTIEDHGNFGALSWSAAVAGLAANV